MLAWHSVTSSDLVMVCQLSATFPTLSPRRGASGHSHRSATSQIPLPYSHTPPGVILFRPLGWVQFSLSDCFTKRARLDEDTEPTAGH